MKVKSIMLILGIIAYSFSLSAQNKETQCEQFYKEAKSAYDKEDYEVALIFFNRCKTEGCSNIDFQIYIDVCNMKLGKKNINNGVEINGVIWATCNVDAPGKFTAQPQNYGKRYTWKESQNVCPTGWRLPTEEDLKKLIDSGTSIWTGDGIYFGSGDNRVFFPAAGSRDGAFYDVSSCGYYWSSTPCLATSECAYGLILHSENVYTLARNSRFDFSVRCVSE